MDVAVEVRGEGTPVLLVHATGTSLRWWEPVVADLAADHRVIAYDRRGYGRTGGPPVRSVVRHAHDAAAVLEAHAERPAVVVGWSSGGTVALHLARLRPELLRGLVLAEPAVHAVRSATPDFLAAAARAKALQARGRTVEAAEHFERWASSGSLDRLPAELHEDVRTSARSVLADLDGHPRGAGGELLRLRRIAALPLPVTLIEGDRSQPWFTRMGARLKRAIPHLRAETLAGAGHYLPFDDPQGFAAAVRRAVVATAPDGPRTPSPA